MNLVMGIGARGVKAFFVRCTINGMARQNVSRPHAERAPGCHRTPLLQDLPVPPERNRTDQNDLETENTTVAPQASPQDGSSVSI